MKKMLISTKQVLVALLKSGGMLTLLLIIFSVAIGFQLRNDFLDVLNGTDVRSRYFAIDFLVQFGMGILVFVVLMGVWIWYSMSKEKLKAYRFSVMFSYTLTLVLFNVVIGAVIASVVFLTNISLDNYVLNIYLLGLCIAAISWYSLLSKIISKLKKVEEIGDMLKMNLIEGLVQISYLVIPLLLIVVGLSFLAKEQGREIFAMVGIVAIISLYLGTVGLTQILVLVLKTQK